MTGARGRVGSSVVTELEKLGVPCRAASRRDVGTRGERTLPVRFDWTDRESVDHAFAGCRAAFLVLPEESAGLAPHLGDVIVRVPKDVRLVLLSAMSAQVAAELTGIGAIEAAIRSRSGPFTILRPNTFTQLFTRGAVLASIRETGTILAPTGAAQVSFVDAEDVGAVAASILACHDDRYSEAELTLTGPAALSFADVARVCSEVLGRTVRHDDVSALEHATRLERFGLPTSVVRLLGVFFGALRSGAHSAVDRTVATLLAREARSVEDVIRRELS